MYNIDFYDETKADYEDKWPIVAGASLYVPLATLSIQPASIVFASITFLRDIIAVGF